MSDKTKYSFAPETLTVSGGFYTAIRELKQLHIGMDAVLEMYATSASKKFDKLSPLQFMKDFAAYTWKKDNRTALDNSIYEMFWDQNVSDNIVILDPNPFLIFPLRVQSFSGSSSNRFAGGKRTIC